MKLQLFDILTAMIVTILFLIILEVFNSTFLPLIGISNHRLPFNILIILFLGFKLDNPGVAILIFIFQYIHSFFSIEGWAMGTFAGTVVCMSISYLKDMIHLSSPIVTIVVTQLFQLLWLVIVSIFIYIQLGSMSYVLEKFIRFLPESLVLSCLAPFIFALLEKIWRVNSKGLITEEG